MLSGRILKVATAEDAKRIREENKRIIELQYERVKNYKLLKRYPSPDEAVIPLNIYQTWHSKPLPPLMRENVRRLKEGHPNFRYFLYDDFNCREFIRNNFDADVVNAFDRLIPGAYKADLWRYCVLFINGGIYMDIKYSCINTFKMIELITREHFVLDIDERCIYNALMAVKPQNAIIGKCIAKVVENVKNRYYGSSCLSPTGPDMMAQFFTADDYSNIILEHVFDKKKNSKLIVMNQVPVLKMYKGYYEEQDRFKRVKHYGGLWDERKIYT